MRIPTAFPSRSERGTTLAELMVALVVLSIGILAVGQLFPAASRTQLKARMTSAANYYAQEKLEQVRSLSWTDADLNDGRHPGSGAEALGSAGQWQRYYEVGTMAAPLGNLKQVTVTVEWNFLGPRSVTTTTYVRR
jgi:prepilin-type N-terminal cleavage/methylation domain-containing protein